MRAHAEEYLDSALADFEANRYHVAYENARTAAEIAGKALLLQAQGSYPQKHAIGGDLFQAGLIPKHLDPRRVSRLLKERTRADYGYLEPIPPDEISEAIEIAKSFLQA